ncbi:uncharacterized protein FIBRA_05593 [Fibroporia radiculosa]|uniref:Enoyl reductase (ER) domain-containing protein n=1 Tax=Fibroporia radiculosa TaxID=599839 RepID=J4GRA7_9APHY|nr:uncharacterized protein FIBRA_05593 [Fibroporia radiculosa]CCM03460.1 predicted protein [Fibroporia radiculosa]
MSNFTPPSTYKAYAFTEKGGSLKQLTFDWKDPQLVPTHRSPVAYSDEVVKHQSMPQVKYPLVPGHEIIGDVVAIPSTEQHWKLGQRVGGGWHGGHCGVCNRCRVGDFITCDKEDINGIARHGGYAEFVTLRTEAVVGIPGDMDPAEVAPLLCAGVTTFISLRNMNCKPPDIVAIQGIGGLGHLGVQFAKAMGYRTIALSSSQAKRDLALSLGAHFYIAGSPEEQAAALQEFGGAKVIMTTAPDSQSVQTLISGLGIEGELLVLGLAGQISFDSVSMIIKRHSVRGWPSGIPTDIEACVLFAKTHGIKTMVEIFSLDQANEAYERCGSAQFRAVIVP